MRKVFGAFLFSFILLGVALADKIVPSRIPDAVGWEIRETVLPCGLLVQKQYVSAVQGVRWFLNYLDNLENPLSVSKETPTSYEVWLDRNRDGIFDEYFTVRGLMASKYPSPCDALKTKK